MTAQPIHYIVPMVTPLLPCGEIDYPSCERLLKHFVAGGVDGVLLLGSIGEFFGLTREQKHKLIPFVRERLENKELIVGTTDLVFSEMAALSHYALEQGADGVMILPPYYFHFTEESLVEYYGQLAREIPGNVYLYNFPDRTGYDISPAVVRTLAETYPNIVGIKDSVSGVDHTREIIKQVRPIRPDFRIYSGFDDNFVHNILCGGNGCIAGIANLYPELTASWAEAARNGDLEKMRQIQRRVDALMDIYSVGKPFVPYIKEALVLLGILRHNTATKPMPQVTEAQREKLRAILQR